MKKAALLGLLYLFQAAPLHAAEETRPAGDVHVLTLNVTVGDRQIMAPVVGLIDGEPATVAVEDGGEQYTLRLLLKTKPALPKVGDAIQVESDLLTGRDRPQSIFSPMMVLRSGSSGKVSTSSDRGEIVIEVLNHAVKPLSAS